MMNERKLFINGQWVAQTDGSVIDDTCPLDGALYARVHTAGSSDLESALCAAQAAFPTWSRKLAHEREKLINDAAAELERRMDDAVALLIDEAGSAWLKASAEVRGTIDLMRSAAGECRRVNGEVFMPAITDNFSFSVRVPMGVILGIAPFNYPLLIAMKKVVYALAAGNTVILKPATATPLTGLFIAEIFESVGLPAGALNVVPCAGALVGKQLISDPRIKAVSFTGSYEVGAQIASQAGALMKRCCMELGGKNPMIVLDDYDVDEAVRISGYGAFLNQGQVCMATSRIIVGSAIYEEFCQKMKLRAENIKVGDPHDHDTVVGPLIRTSQCELIDRQIQDALSKGARLLTGGTHTGPFYAPTVLADVTPEMDIFYDESFGPVTSIVRADDSEHALALCNDNHYGLSAALLTNDVTKAVSMSLRMDSGKIHVNNSTMVLSNTAPSGGFRMSGMGKENGRYFIEELTDLKWITIQYGPTKFSF